MEWFHINNWYAPHASCLSFIYIIASTALTTNYLTIQLSGSLQLCFVGAVWSWDRFASIQIYHQIKLKHFATVPSRITTKIGSHVTLWWWCKRDHRLVWCTGDISIVLHSGVRESNEIQLRSNSKKETGRTNTHFSINSRSFGCQCVVVRLFV